MHSKAHFLTEFLKLLKSISNTKGQSLERLPYVVCTLVQGPRWATFITDEVGTEFLISDECFFFNKTEASDWL